MRKGNNPKFIHIAQDDMLIFPERHNRTQSAVVGLDPTTRLLAVNFGSDYCAEHESGIKRLYEAFGVKNEIKVYGIKKRKITKVPKSLVWVKLIDGRQGFAYRSFWSHSAEINLAGDDEMQAYDVFDRDTNKMKPNPVQLVCGWSDDDFACLSKDPTDIKYLREIFTQFKKKNIIFTFSSVLPAFENQGLIIAIADRMPKKVVKEFSAADKESHEIEKFVAKSKIRELLKEKHKGYFALSPSRSADGTMTFWLNPYDQDKVNYGWFTLEQLRQWADDKGPIPMSSSQITEYREKRSGKRATV